MPRVEVLNTGSELLLGTTVNIHGAWLGEELFKVGLRVSQQSTVPDGDGSPIIESIHNAIERKTELLFITGGLGPTSDDLTREATAQALGLNLIKDEQALESLQCYFEKKGRVMPTSNLRQAMVPAGAEILPNEVGTAPGLYLPPRLAGGCSLFLLPGPPHELREMFYREVLPLLLSFFDLEGLPQCLELKFTGVSESDFHDKVGAALKEWHKRESLEYGYCARIGEVDLRLIGEAEVVHKARDLVESAFSRQLVSDDGRTLEEVVVGLATGRAVTLATAESCTGGLIAKRLTDVAGSSAVFTHGFVTYSNQAKIDLLDVSHSDLEKHGAVSQTIARQMAEGALKRARANYAVAVSGIAGPSGGSTEKPVGTCYLALAVMGGSTRDFKVFQAGLREVFRLGISQRALDLLRVSLLGR